MCLKELGFCFLGYIPVQPKSNSFICHQSNILVDSRWTTFLPNLKEVEKLLHNKMNRERFCATCIPKDHDHLLRLVMHWDLSLKSLRWEQVVDFIAAAAKLYSIVHVEYVRGDQVLCLAHSNLSIPISNMELDIQQHTALHTLCTYWALLSC